MFGIAAAQGQVADRRKHIDKRDGVRWVHIGKAVTRVPPAQRGRKRLHLSRIVLDHGAGTNSHSRYLECCPSL